MYLRLKRPLASASIGTEPEVRLDLPREGSSRTFARFCGMVSAVVFAIRIRVRRLGEPLAGESPAAHQEIGNCLRSLAGPKARAESHQPISTRFTHRADRCMPPPLRQSSSEVLFAPIRRR